MGDRVGLRRSGLPEATRVRRWRRSQLLAPGLQQERRLGADEAAGRLRRGAQARRRRVPARDRAPHRPL